MPGFAMLFALYECTVKPIGPMYVAAASRQLASVHLCNNKEDKQRETALCSKQLTVD